MIGRYLYGILRPIILSLIELRDRAGIPALYLSFLNLALMLTAAVLVIISSPVSAAEDPQHLLIYAAVLILIAGIVGLVDTTIGDEQDRVYDYRDFVGNIFDVSGELFIYLAVTFHLFKYDSLVFGFIGMMAMTSTLFINYIKGFAEHIVDHCDIGISSRFERITLIMIFMIFNYTIIGVVVVLFLNAVAIYQKIYYVHSKYPGEGLFKRK